MGDFQPLPLVTLAISAGFCTLVNMRIPGLILALGFGVLQLQSQNEFDKYGPYGAEVFKDLKEALKTDKKVYKMDLSYQVLDLKVYDKLPKLSDLQALKLSGNGVTGYPPGFENMSNLVYFASYNNKLKSFPPLLQNFRNLQYLDIQHSSIDSVPASIAYLNRLQSLKFGNTGDTIFLPQTLHYLKSLKDLTIEDCVLDSFPKEVFKIPSLTYLYLSGTNTWRITSHFERLSNLEVLVLENNHLTELPFTIYKAYKLRILSLRGNNIMRLPDSISQLENLTILDLRGNPIDAEELEKIKLLLPGCQVRF